MINDATIHLDTWCHKASPAFAGREMQSREATTVAAYASHDRLRMLAALAPGNDGPLMTGAQVMIADCIAAATLHYAEGLYGVPLPGGCPTLVQWLAFFSERPSAAPVPYPAPRLALAHELPSVCAPSAGQRNTPLP